jgi:hypothetical protein
VTDDETLTLAFFAGFLAALGASEYRVRQATSPHQRWRSTADANLLGQDWKRVALDLTRTRPDRTAAA